MRILLTKRFCAIKIMIFAGISAAVLLLPLRSADAGKITDDLKAVINKVVNTLTDPAYAAADKKDERERLINNIVSEKFDFAEMAKRSLGIHWRNITPQQQEEFVKIFRDFLEKTYISKVDLFLNKKKNFTSKNISYQKEIIDGKYAMVQTKISINGDELPVNYKLMDKKGNWAVYDITIEGVGIVANYRAQFNEILAKQTFNDLIEKIKSKALKTIDKEETPGKGNHQNSPQKQENESGKR